MRLWFYDKIYEKVFRNNEFLIDHGEFNQRASTIHLEKKDLSRIKKDMAALEYLKFKNRGGKNLERLKDLFGD